MTGKERAYKAFEWFRRERPVVETELHYRTPFELVVAVVLSAQCTDVRVNMITPGLFKSYPTAAFMKNAREEDLFDLIRSVTYPNSKARHLIALSKVIDEEYGGEVPKTFGELIRLPGVGRKTANVLLSVLFKEPTIAVDTHVYRVSRRIGLVPLSANTPAKVEQKLLSVVPAEYLDNAHHWLLLHGRYTCTARKPSCETCGLTDLCRFFAKKAPGEDSFPKTAPKKPSTPKPGLTPQTPNPGLRTPK